MSKEDAFIELVNTAALQRGCEFFVSNGEGRDFETDNLIGEDLFGWLIPVEQVSAFQKEFETNTISDRWTDHMRFAIWHKTDDFITIDFKKS